MAETVGCLCVQKKNFLLSEISLVKGLLINQRHCKFFNSEDSNLVRRLNKYTCNVENCNNLDEFCILTKHDFPCESEVKKKLFGNLFDNHESNEVIRHCFDATTLGQTFMNDFALYKVPFNHI